MFQNSAIYSYFHPSYDTSKPNPFSPSTDAIGALHVALDVFGLFPRPGEFADGINAIIYTIEEDYTNAGYSLGAVTLPIGGQFYFVEIY